MRLRVLQCPRCGAPLPKRAALVRVVCEYCHSEITIERYSVKAAEYRGALADYSATGGASVLQVGGVSYRLSGRMATGHSTDVWLAERATRLSERVVIKVLRHVEDEPCLLHEQRVLAELEQSTERGADYFATLLPQRAGFGVSMRPGTAPMPAAVFREPVGFAHTLLDLRRAYPGGADPRHLVWIWRRVLELLSWVHRSGKIHGAVLPAHVLIHAGDHAARLVGWSNAVDLGRPLALAATSDLDVYPEAALGGDALSARSDLCMLARSLLKIFAGRVDASPSSLPAEVLQLLEREASGAGGADAWQLSEEVSQAARAGFGPPKFVELVLP